MSAIVKKLKQLNKTKVFLPSINEEREIDKVNINFQNKLQRTIVGVDKEHTIAVIYLLYLNEHIQNQLQDVSVTYLDKTSILYTWKRAVKDEDVIDFTQVPDLEAITHILEFGDTNITVKFKNPTLDYENRLLTYLKNKKDMTEFDFVFFDTFRYIKSLAFDDDTVFEAKELTIDELYEIYLTFNIPTIKSINDKVTSELKFIDTIRGVEGDLSFYTDL
jgi:hypothetical protein